MICCTSLLLILGWAALGQAQRPARQLALLLRLGWGLWGGGLAVLAYVVLVGALLSTGAVVFVDQHAHCLSATDDAVRAVPAEWVAPRWVARTLTLLAGALSMMAAAIALLRRTGSLLRTEARALQLGAGLAWLVATLIDHQLFGLYAPVAGGWLADAAMHLPGAVLAASASMRTDTERSLTLDA